MRAMSRNTEIHDATIGGVRRGRNGSVLITDPADLYRDVGSAKHYLRARRSKTYSSGFHADGIELTTAHIPLFFPRRNVRLFELGPGYPDTTLPVMRAAEAAGVNLSYWPVDISEMFLEVAAMAAEEYLPEEKIFRLHRRFERMSELNIPNPENAANIFMLGPTVMNFPKSYASRLLGSMMKNPDDTAVVIYETITSKNPIEKILQQYQGEEVREFTFGPLKNLGFKIEQTDYAAVFNKAAGRIECTHTFKKIWEDVVRDKQINKVDLKNIITDERPFASVWENTIESLEELIHGDVIFFRPGQSATTGVSYRKTASAWKRGFQRDFEEVTTYTAKSGSTVLAFLRGPKFDTSRPLISLAA